MKIRHKNLILVILLISLVFLSSCGSECKKSSDCPRKTCFIIKCTDKKCVEDPRDNCCGNGNCEATAGETKCSCETDCGKCTGEAGIYLDYMCDGNECVSDVKKDLQEEKKFTDKISIRNAGDISFTYGYNNPFNIDKDLFNVRFVLDKMQSGIQSIKINKINIYESVSRRGEQVKNYGEKIVEQTLWDTRTDVTDEVILEFPSNMSDANKKLTIEVIYEYAKLYRGNINMLSGTYKKSLQEEIYFVNPSKKRKCPSSCDDNNICTTDSCSASTNYFCKHEVKEGVSCCGNHKCDSNEDECSCQQDCGYCEKEFGEYIQFSCVNNKCSSSLRTDAVPKTMIESASMSDITIEMKTNFNEPFDIGLDKFKVDLELQLMGSTISNVKCNKLQVLSGDELLAEKDITASFTIIGSTYSSEVATSFSMKEVEEDKGTIIKITCSYDKTVNDVKTSYIKTDTQNLGTISYVDVDV